MTKLMLPGRFSRFISISNSESRCNWILRYQDWIIVEQGIDKQIYCEFSDGFYIYNNKVWYQDVNLDGTNELFTLDDDNDSVLDAPDNCQSVPNLDQLNTDNDSHGNACDDDDDGDGVLDSQDAFPLDIPNLATRTQMVLAIIPIGRRMIVLSLLILMVMA